MPAIRAASSSVSAAPPGRWQSWHSARVSVAFRNASSPQADSMAGAAVGNEGEGHAGEGQKIHGAEHVQAGLKHQQGSLPHRRRSYRSWIGPSGDGAHGKQWPASGCRPPPAAAISSPHSSQSMPNTRSVSGSGHTFEPAVSGPHARTGRRRRRPTWCGSADSRCRRHASQAWPQAANAAQQCRA